MKIIKSILPLCSLLSISFFVHATHEPTLKEALKDKFYIGTALNLEQIRGNDKKAEEIVKQQFNSIVAENCMKSMYLQPTEGKFNFNDADKFVEFGEKNNMFLIGHTLIWHSQTPRWFFVDENGAEVSRDVLIERMRKHITTVVSRYKGRIKGWDVVNEAVLDDGSFRKSKFYQIIGEDFIKLAFEFAHLADPDAELYYNDYSMAVEAKRNGVVKMVQKLQADGIKVSGIGMQGHLSLDFPTVSNFEKSLLAFSELNVNVMITELDITVLPTPNRNIGAEVSASFEYKNEMNPYSAGLPAEKEKELETRYADFFRLFLKHHDKISRVTLWGVTDADSWRNNWPVRGRTDYALLFDRNFKPKPVVKQIIEMATSK
jgi:endo-1,4-beta-xylanase